MGLLLKLLGVQCWTRVQYFTNRKSWTQLSDCSCDLLTMFLWLHCTNLGRNMDSA